MRIFSITPHAPLFIGDLISSDKEATREYIPSDTLFAAMVMAWKWQGSLEARLAQCLSQPASFQITSAFPRAGDVRLLPMPLGLRLNLGQHSLIGKARKRIRWVSEGVFKRMIAFGDLSSELTPESFAQAGAVWLLRDESRKVREQLKQPEDPLKFWEDGTNPRVSIDRVSSASNFFETAQIRFAAGCGLWFAVTGEWAWAEQALQQLQDSGLGGMRSVGHGAFSFASADVSPWPAAPGDYAVLLSRFAPATPDEMREVLYAPHSAFSLVTVGGWCNDDAGKAWRRKHVRMVAEGSLIGKRAVGRLVDAHPDVVMDRAAYRNGYAFGVAVQPQAVSA